MVSSDSAILVAWFQNSKNYGGAAVYEYKSKLLLNYIRNSLLSRKQTLKKKAFDTNSIPRHLNIVSDFHT